MSTPKKVGGGTQGVPSTSKSRGTCPSVHPWIYAHALQQLLTITLPNYLSNDRTY